MSFLVFLRFLVAVLCCFGVGESFFIVFGFFVFCFLFFSLIFFLGGFLGFYVFLFVFWGFLFVFRCFRFS